MRVLDLFAGLGGWSTPFAERGHDVVTVDIEERFGCTYTADVLEWEPEGEFDIVLASPPCESFSVLTIGRNWATGYQPATDAARLGMALVRRTVELVERLEPSFWIIENPRAMLRKLYLLPFERRTVTYCQYGAPWRKPTDLWGGFPPSLELRAMCSNGDPCHIAAPRGSRSGVQGEGWGWAASTWSTSPARRDAAAIRAEIPRELALDVCLAAERDHEAGRRAADYTGTLFEGVMSTQTGTDRERL